MKVSARKLMLPAGFSKLAYPQIRTFHFFFDRVFNILSLNLLDAETAPGCHAQNLATIQADLRTRVIL